MTWITPLERFRGRPAVVTGAGGGIGRAVAIGLAARGLDVVLCDVREDLVREAEAEATALGVTALGIAVDVSDSAAVGQMAIRVLDRFGAPGIVVASAGVSPRPLRPIWENSQQDWQWVMGVNFWGVVHTVSAFLPSMLSLDGARHVVTVNSMSQFRGMSGHATYVTSKRAAEGFAECLAIDVAPHGIDVTTVYPGRVRTGLSASESLRPAEERSSARDITAVDIPPGALVNNPMLEPAEVAEAIIAGIENRRSHVLTHTPPAGTMIDRLSRILDTQLVPEPSLAGSISAGTPSGRTEQ